MLGSGSFSLSLIRLLGFPGAKSPSSGRKIQVQTDTGPAREARLWTEESGLGSELCSLKIETHT